MSKKSTSHRHLLGLAAALGLVLVAPAASKNETAFSGWRGASLHGRVGPLPATASRRLAATSWVGRAYEVSGGERVRVFVSTAYADADARGQRWADYFASLPHGEELARLTAYVAPIADVAEICAAERVLGCYGGERLVTMGEDNSGVSAASVATHEYGHHVAANRLNPPWAAIDWGTKRWATYEHVCERVADGTAYPGNESSAYALNPGEAFAESYRVLVETGGTAANYDWRIVDPSFMPDAQALALLRQDVLNAWAEAAPVILRGRFGGRARRWSTRIATPLDGDLRIRLTVPNQGVDGLSLLGADGRVVATGSWTGDARTVDYRICGARSVNVLVTRGRGASARFTLRVDAP